MSHLIEFQNVNKKFDLSAHAVTTALQNINLSIRAGEFVCIMGRSGSGKSTLLSLMGLLDSPTNGKILINGHEVEKLSDYELSLIRRQQIGFIFQTFNLIPVLSALENVEYPLMLLGLTPQERREKATQALSQLGLSELIHNRPSQMSGGQRQRVAIARALVKNPKYILADEPTANLDSQTSEDIIKTLTDIHQKLGTTIIFCSHDPQVMAMAKRVVRIKDGKLETTL